MTTTLRALCLLFLLGLSACQSTSQQQVLQSTKPTLEIRAMQSRMFDTSDRSKVLRGAIATLQDLGYSIEKVEASAGSVSARKLAALEISVSVFPRGKKQTIVRANATIRTPNGANQVDDPAFYQQRFFEPLSKSLFLAAQNDPDAGAADAATVKKPTN
jgi:hypothetical protein